MTYSNIQYTNEGLEVPDDINIHLDSKDITFANEKSERIELLSFSGFVVENQKIFASFPKHFTVNNQEVRGDIQLLFNTIMKHYKDNQNLYLTKAANLETNFPFNSFFSIYEYYQKYGIYDEEHVETRQGYDGIVLWKDTIKKSTKIVSESGLLFLPLSIKKKNRKHVLISECMAYAIDYTLQQFSFFLDLPKVGGNSLKTNFLNHRIYVIRELHNLKNTVFKDIHKKLLSDLIEFFNQLPRGGSYYLKHYSFNMVWEEMVKHYLNYHFVSINSGSLQFSDSVKIRNNFQKINFTPNSANANQTIQPDHYFADKDRQYIFDSKYYNDIKSVNYKQIAYYFFLKNFKGKKFRLTYNALILPGDKKQKIHFEFNSEYNNEEPDFVIYEYYLNVRNLMTLFLAEK